jgi:hypothetical protein
LREKPEKFEEENRNLFGEIFKKKSHKPLKILGEKMKS